jgi:lysophospholipase L1-like esterase
VDLLLPETIVAVPGIETNVYFDNVTLVLDVDDYAFDVTCEKGKQQAERWTFNPGPDDVGGYAFTLEVRDGTNAVIAIGTSTLHVVSVNALEGQPRSLLLIGDSLTHASVYSQHLLDLCAAPGNPALTLVGSHVPDESKPLNRHEGYGGRTAQRFATQYADPSKAGNYKERGSPFLYLNDAGEPELDFTRYCQDVNEGRFPDAVTIFLGCNDTFSATDETIQARMNDMFAALDLLIAAIHSVSPSTRIGLIPPVPPTSSQDAFGANYKNGQTRWQYKRNQHAVVRAMYERYATNESLRVSLIPAFTNLDCERNYPASAAPWNARTNTEVTRQNNGVHPSAEGYRQIGDAIYCWMKSE